MQFIIRKPWDLPQSRHTPPDVYRNRNVPRREFLKAIGCGAAGMVVATLSTGCSRPTEEEIEASGAADAIPPAIADVFPVERNPDFDYGRPETLKRDALEFTNFYEFSSRKDSWMHVGRFTPYPWTVEVGGLCSKPRTFDIDDIHKLFRFEERAYRHRCVETWAMCVPWTGFPFRDLLKLVEPKPAARFVEMETFNRPHEAPGMKRQSSYPWPYIEGLTIEEATNELALIATGLYGEPLAKQNGAPVRLVVPWKYGFKSIKSIVRITLTDKQPATFWNTEWPAAYDFTANVDPAVSHPSWSQKTEWMIPNRSERYDSVKYNGYGDYVGKLYAS